MRKRSRLPKTAVSSDRNCKGWLPSTCLGTGRYMRVCMDVCGVWHLRWRARIKLCVTRASRLFFGQLVASLAAFRLFIGQLVADVWYISRLHCQKYVFVFVLKTI